MIAKKAVRWYKLYLDIPGKLNEKLTRHFQEPGVAVEFHEARTNWKRPYMYAKVTAHPFRIGEIDNYARLHMSENQAEIMYRAPAKKLTRLHAAYIDGKKVKI